jgi:predicted  nucleic acid-binding Zn-ribbon protein
MNFLNKIFGVKENSLKKETISLEFNELIRFLEDFYSKSFIEDSKKIFSNFAEIKHLVKELSTLVREIESLEVEVNEGNPKLRKIVSTSKKTLTEKMNSLIPKLVPLESHDFIELNSYCDASLKLLESEINSFGRNIAYTGIVLKEPIKKLGEKINELNSVFLKTKELFNARSNLLLLPEVKETFSELNELIDSKKNSLLSEKEIQEKISLTKKQLQEKERKLTELQESREAKEFSFLLKEKSALASKKQELKLKLIEFFYPVEKLLKSLGKLSETKRFILNEQEKSLLSFYLSNPFLALKKDANAVVLKKLLAYIKELVFKGEISLKEKEKAKKLSALNELLEYNFFDEVFWKLNEIEKKSIEIESKINSLNVSKKISSLQEEINSLRNSLKVYSKELENQKNKTKKISLEISSLKDSLERKASDFSGKKIQISLPE